jgi:hypothetical protein
VLRKLLIGLSVLVVLLVATALIAPGFIDWTRYREPILAQATQALGRPVGIDGTLRFSILPSPTLSVSDVWIANVPGASEAKLVSVGALDVHVALLPLLSGRVEVSSITLVNPLISLEVLKDGTQNWAFSSTDAGGGGAAPALRIDNIGITDGAVSYSDAASGQTVRLDGLDATLRLDSLSGPFEIKADARLGGILPVETAIRLDATVGRRAAGGAFPVRSTLSLPDSGASVAYQGIFNPGASTVAQGEARLEADDLGKVIAALTGAAQGDKPAIPAQLRSQLASDGQSLDLNNMDFTINGTRGSGAVQLSVQDGLPRADVVLALASVDLDAWMKAMAGGSEEPSSAPFALPKDVSAKLDISADAITYRGGLVRQAKLIAALEGGAVLAERMGAQLPGGASVSATGSFYIDGKGAPHLEADFEANAEDARATLAWLGIDVPSVPSDRLRKVSVAAGVSGTPENFRIPAFEAKIDGSSIDGALQYESRGARPKLTARIEADRLNVDAYMAPDSATKPATDATGMPALPFDANVDANFGQLTVNGLTLGGVSVAGSLVDGALSIRQARIADALGTTISVMGGVAKLQPLSGLDLSADISSANVGPLLQALTGQPPTLDARLRAVKGSGRFQGDAAEATLQMQASAGPLALEVGGTIKQMLLAPAFDVRVRVRHPEMKGLLALVAPDWKPRAASLGAVDVYANVAGTQTAVKISGLQGKLGAVTLQGEGEWRAGDARPYVAATLKTSDIALDPWLPAESRATAVPVPVAQGGHWSDEPLQWSGLRAVDGAFDVTLRGLNWGAYDVGNVVLKAQLDDGTLTLETLSGDGGSGRWQRWLDCWKNEPVAGAHCPGTGGHGWRGPIGGRARFRSRYQRGRCQPAQDGGGVERQGLPGCAQRRVAGL